MSLVDWLLVVWITLLLLLLLLLHNPNIPVVPAPITEHPPVILYQELTRQQLHHHCIQHPQDLWIAILGDIFDVSSKSSFYGPDGPYYAMVGRDATWMLARHQLHSQPEDVHHHPDYSINRPIYETMLTPDELDTAREWYAHFHAKYTRIGHLIYPTSSHSQ